MVGICKPVVAAGEKRKRKQGQSLRGVERIEGDGMELSVSLCR